MTRLSAIMAGAGVAWVFLNIATIPAVWVFVVGGGMARAMVAMMSAMSVTKKIMVFFTSASSFQVMFRYSKRYHMPNYRICQVV
jgi:hypothetical protein